MTLKGSASVHDTILKPRSALTGLIEDGRHGLQDGNVGIRISEVRNFALVNMNAYRNCRQPLENAINKCFGLDLPSGPQRFEKNGVAIIGLGPDQWFMMSYEENSAGFVDELEKASRDRAAIVDQSDAWAIARVSGPAARAALAKGVSVDLDPQSFHVNSVATTVVAGIWTHLWQIDDSPAYEISVFRGFGSSFMSWLKESATEFGYVNQ